MVSKRKNAGSLAIVIVAYGHEEYLPELICRLTEEKLPGDQIIVVDNHPDHSSALISEKLAAVDKVIRSENVGFAAACNRAVRELKGSIELVLLLNPDTLPTSGALRVLRSQADPEWAAWMGMVTLPDGRINTNGTVLHLSGLSWCGALGRHAQADAPKREVAFISGACMMVRRRIWEELGGLPEDYFLYYEDTDFSLSLWRRGHRMGIIPGARFEHDYEFNKGAAKWFYLERNRYVLILRHWPLRVLLVTLPLLAAIEPVLWLASVVQGRVWLRARSVAAFFRVLPRTLRSRGAVSRYDRRSGVEFFRLLHPYFDSPLFGKAGSSTITKAALGAYQKLADGILAITAAF